MRAEIAEVIRQTRHTLTVKTWVPHDPWGNAGQVCAFTAVPGDEGSSPTWGAWEAFAEIIGWWSPLDSPEDVIAAWNDRQTDVGAVLGMTLEALIAELCKPEVAAQDQP